MTAGNASGVNDGAAALLIASAAAVKQHGLTPIARITTEYKGYRRFLTGGRLITERQH